MTETPKGKLAVEDDKKLGPPYVYPENRKQTTLVKQTDPNQLNNWTITFGASSEETTDDDKGDGAKVSQIKTDTTESANRILINSDEVQTSHRFDDLDDLENKYNDRELLDLEGRPAEEFAKKVTVFETGNPVTYGEVDGVFYKTAAPLIKPIVKGAEWLYKLRPDLQKGVVKGALIEGPTNLNNAVADLFSLPSRYGTKVAADITNRLFGTKLKGAQENYFKTGMNDFLNWVGEYIPYNSDVKDWTQEKTEYPAVQEAVTLISQFGINAVPAATIVKGLTSANAIARGYMWAAWADAVSFDNDHTTMVQDFGMLDYLETASEGEKNAFLNTVRYIGNFYFENNPDEAEANRFRLALEGALIGKGVESLFTFIPKFIKFMPWKKAFAALAVAAAAAPEEAEGAASIISKIFSKGLIGDPKTVAGNLKRLQARQKALEEKGKPLPGKPNLPRIVVKAPNKKLPHFVVGDITFDDWIKRTEKLLDKNEIVATSKFYEDTKAVFLKHAGGDEDLADKYMTAWLVANQNITPLGAMQNVLLQAEQFARNTPVDSLKAGGMPNPTGAARNVIAGEPIEKGVGQKIFDFVDSGLKKDTRSWMDNNVAGGKPFVVDVHTARDTGLVDATLINHLKRLGYDTTELEKAQKGKPFDFGDSVGETKYENRADFGRRLTDHLNKIGWQGRKDWEPREVQAVGWGALTKFTQDVAPSVDEALTQSLRRISFEIEPGAGSPWAAKYNDRWNKLPIESRTTITENIGNRAMEMAAKGSGIDVRRIVHATGGWTYKGETGQAAAAVAEAYASKQGAELAANYLGYLTNQTEVWVNTIKNATKSPTGFAIDLVETGTRNLDSNEAVLKFWDEIVAADKDGVFGGYQMIRGAGGEPVMRLLVQKQKGISGQKLRTNIENIIENNINAVLEKQSFNIDIFARDADILITGNDWKKVKDGKSYLARVAEISGRSTAGNLNRDGKELTKLLDSEIGKAEGGTKAKSGDGQVDNGFGQKVIPLTDDRLKSSLPTTQFLVSEIKKAVPNAQFGLNKSQTQMGPSDYLHIKVPGKPKIEIRLSNHGTGVRRTMDYFKHFPDYIPQKGKPEFGKISRESFDKRINEVINFLKNK